MLKRISSVLMLLIISTATYAQIINPCDGTDPDDPLCLDIPLDTWLFILVIAAVVFGAYRLYSNKKNLAI